LSICWRSRPPMISSASGQNGRTNAAVRRAQRDGPHDSGRAAARRGRLRRHGCSARRDPDALFICRCAVRIPGARLVSRGTSADRSDQSQQVLLTGVLTFASTDGIYLCSRRSIRECADKPGRRYRQSTRFALKSGEDMRSLRAFRREIGRLSPALAFARRPDIAFADDVTATSVPPGATEVSPPPIRKLQISD
jgi:hypothetical protein